MKMPTWPLSTLPSRPSHCRCTPAEAPPFLANPEGSKTITPSGVHELVRSGHEVFVEKDAGVGSRILDSDFVAAGATILPSADDVWQTGDLILKVKEPIAEEYHRMRKGQVLFTYLHLAASRACTDALLASGITAIAYETVQLPDGSLPLLAPMSEVAGRMAPQVGAHHLQRRLDLGTEFLAHGPRELGELEKAGREMLTNLAHWDVAPNMEEISGGTLTRAANPGILDRSHSIGKVIGVFPSTLKSYALCVYFQMYSPETTRYFPNACCKPAWNSFRQPGLSAVGLVAKQPRSGFSTGLAQPMLERTRFSLNGVSSVRAYEARRTVFVRLTL